MEYRFERADKDLFAVYQTIYSGADIEMWFSWKDRLNDTKWSGDSYFLMRSNEKIGGAIISKGLVMYAFLVPPFCDRCLFWKLVIHKAKEITNNGEIEFKGVLWDDVPVLQNYGAKAWRPRQMMCRPTDILEDTVPDGISLETPCEADIAEIAEAEHKAYLGTISYEMFGEDSLEHIIDGLTNFCFKWYQQTDSMDQFVVAKAKGKIIGACVAGMNPEMPNGFAGIDDVFVLPEYRGRGIAGAMIRRAVSAAYGRTPVMKLHVLVNNPAACLYRNLGFTAGPVFTDMKMNEDT